MNVSYRVAKQGLRSSELVAPSPHAFPAEGAQGPFAAALRQHGLPTSLPFRQHTTASTSTGAHP